MGAGEVVKVQEYEPFEINDQNALAPCPRSRPLPTTQYINRKYQWVSFPNSLRGTSLINGSGIGLTYSSGSGRRNTLTLFSPAFDLDDHQNGTAELEADISMTTWSSATLGFGTSNSKTARLTDFAFIGELKSSTAWNANRANGISVGSLDVYLGSSKVANIDPILRKRTLRTSLGITWIIEGNRGLRLTISHWGTPCGGLSFPWIRRTFQIPLHS